MPVISRFYGIIIRMYFMAKEHNPPHFHAQYGKHEALINIQTLKVEKGSLPPNALRMAKEWGKMHQKELMQIWETQSFVELPPLE